MGIVCGRVIRDEGLKACKMDNNRTSHLGGVLDFRIWKCWNQFLGVCLRVWMMETGLEVLEFWERVTL